MNNEELKKALDKINKCLKLSGSSNEHEAAAALRQAQAIMNKFGLTQNDVDRAAYTSEIADTAIQAGKKVPIQLMDLVALIRKAFGVQAVFERTRRVSDLNFSIRFFGLEHRVPLAAYAFKVVFKAMEAAWFTYLKDIPDVKRIRGARGSYQVGWLEAVASKIDAIGFSDAEKSTLELIRNDHYGKELSSAKPGLKSVYTNMAADGAADGKSFSIHRPMNGGVELRRLK